MLSIVLDIHVMPGHLIRRIHQAATALFAEECAELDITSVQFAALSAVVAYPDVDATRLSHLIAFDRSTLGGVLERLEAKGWIVREGAEEDRRVKLLRATPAGLALLRRAAPAVRRVQERLLAPLSPSDRRTALRLLTELAALHNDVTPAPLRPRAEAMG